MFGLTTKFNKMKHEIQIIQQELSAFVQEMEATKEHDGAIEMQVRIEPSVVEYYCFIGVGAARQFGGGKTMDEAYWRAVFKYESQP
jgi:hypothetical protein